MADGATRRPLRRPWMGVLALVLAMLGSACTFEPPSPDLSRAQRPLPPDPDFEAPARELCLPIFDVDPNLPLVLQDRRTVDWAVLLFEDDRTRATVVLSLLADGTYSCEAGSGAGSIPDLGLGLSTAEEGLAMNLDQPRWVVVGHVNVDAAVVLIELTDGSEVLASLGHGRFLASWPDPDLAIRELRAIDERGRLIDLGPFGSGY